MSSPRLNTVHTPIDIARIEELVARGETERVEFKINTGQRVPATRTVCAMLNHQGGCVVFGVSPEGVISGQQVSERTIERISQDLYEIEPPPLPAISVVPVEGDMQIILVRVARGPTRPYRYNGVPYFRSGNTTRPMTEDQANQMLFERIHGEQRWENQPADGWSIDDLDGDEIIVTVEQSIETGRIDEPGTRDLTDLLRGMGLIRDDRLLRAGVALFGNFGHIHPDMPQCLLRLARFRSTNRDEFIDNRQIYGNSFSILEQALGFIRQHTPIASRFAPDRVERIDEPLYPLLALREAVANAICHRDYADGGGSVSIAIFDDRLEVTSTGPLHFGLTPDDLFEPHESRPWNPLIADVFYKRGIIERWGNGTIRMAELTSAAGLPRPEIEDRSGAVTVRFRPTSYVPPQRISRDTTPRQRAILAFLHDAQGGLALREITHGLQAGGTKRQIREDLSTLQTLGLTQVIGRGRGARWHILRS